MLSVALEKAALYVNAEAPPISGPALASLAEKYIGVMTMLDRLSRRYDRRVLEQMIYLPGVPAGHAEDAVFMKEWAASLEDALRSTVNGEGAEYSVDVIESDNAIVSLSVRRGQHGVDEMTQLPIYFLDSPEYARIVALGVDLADLIGEGAYVIRGEHRKEITAFRQAIDWLMAEARRGLTIQRYKGLGEMNPEQLWDTTVNPETRRLMKVRIEDAVSADEIFTTLMGDQVEPRREFIERNALAVANLDI